MKKRLIENISSFKRNNAMRIILLLLMFFFYTPLAFAHGDEDHSQDAGQPAATAAPVKPKAETGPLNIERTVETNEGSFKFNITQTPTGAKEDEPVNFNIQVLDNGSQPLAGGQLTVEIRKNNELDKSLIAEEDKAKPGNYNFSYTFSDGETYQVSASLATGDKGKIPVTFPVIVQGSETNFKALGLDALAILLAAGAVFLFYRRANATRPHNTAVKHTSAFGAVTLATLITTIAVIHQLVHPEETVVAGTAASSDLTTAGNTIELPKETQLLFNIRTAPASEREIISGLTVNGVIRTRPQSRSDIAAPVSGILRMNNFSVGTYVNRGQALGTVQQVLGAPEQIDIQTTLADLRSQLAELQSRIGPAQARLRAARQESERAKIDLQARNAELQAQIEQVRARLANARTELSRARGLYEIGGAPLKRVQEAQLQVNLAELELAAAQKQKTFTIGSEALKRVRDAELEATVNQQEIAGLQKQIAVMEQNQGRIRGNTGFTLISPISGTISQISATSGQQVEAGANVASVINLDRVWLEAQVFEKNLDEITDNGKASFKLASYPNEVFYIGPGTPNRLLTVGTSIDPERRTIPVTYEITNLGNRIREGMFAEVTIDTSGDEKVINIPKDAISDESGIKYVYVFKGGETFEKRQVTVGTQGQKEAEITRGIQPGERVVTQGLYQLKSTMLTKR